MHTLILGFLCAQSNTVGYLWIKRRLFIYQFGEYMCVNTVEQSSSLLLLLGVPLIGRGHILEHHEEHTRLKFVNLFMKSRQ